MSNPCTPAPPAPSGASEDWTDVVRGNCFGNIDRLWQWTGGDSTVIPLGTSPSNYFQPVTGSSLGSGLNPPPPIYVLIHGWAPGYLTTVQNQNGNVLWWGSNAGSDGSGGLWTSDWAWSQVVVEGTTVNETGFLQSIVAFDESAVVLAYSWLDDSATYSEWDLDEAYQSEAHAHTNGVRLANALFQAIVPSFWPGQGKLTLIGHSHGSKVATVAAFQLQHILSGPVGVPTVDRLAILDSPHCEIAISHGAGNLLGFYLERMQIADPAAPGSGAPGSTGAFVDNYVSYFGVAYGGTATLENIVEVGLDPEDLSWDPGTDHEYAAAFFGGAAVGAEADGQLPLGLAWPPLPPPYAPLASGLVQTWASGEQWVLGSGAPEYTYAYNTQPLGLTPGSSPQTCVTVDTSGTLTFGPPATSPGYCIFNGTYAPPTDNYGIAFDILWLNAQNGDFLVVTIGFLEQSVYFVMDGQSIPGGGATTVAINADMSNDDTAYIYIYFYSQNGTLSLSNSLAVQVPTADDSARLKRHEIAAQRAAKRALRIVEPD